MQTFGQKKRGNRSPVSYATETDGWFGISLPYRRIYTSCINPLKDDLYSIKCFLM